MVIWITGLSGAGKTTLADALAARFKPRVPELVVLDGDAMRALADDDLGYGEADRRRQIGRLQRLARMLEGQGLLVVVAALYANPALLAWNRAHFAAYVEVHVDAALDFVKARDAKGLYRAAARGEAGPVVGIDIPWRPPEAADIVIDASHRPDPDTVALAIARRVPRLAGLIAAPMAVRESGR